MEASRFGVAFARQLSSLVSADELASHCLFVAIRTLANNERKWPPSIRGYCILSVAPCLILVVDYPPEITLLPFSTPFKVGAQSLQHLIGAVINIIPEFRGWTMKFSWKPDGVGGSNSIHCSISCRLQICAIVGLNSTIMAQPENPTEPAIESKCRG
jgi:hypothetical protein